MKPVIQVLVEVENDLVMNGRKQTAFVHLGKRYPVEHEVWVPDTGPYAAGQYWATGCYFTGEKYPRLVVDLSRLTKAEKKAA